MRMQNNSGHHSLEKYKNANCVLINESEMRHELRDRQSNVKKLVISLSKKLRAKFPIIVTRGNEGSIFIIIKRKFWTVQLL